MISPLSAAVVTNSMRGFSGQRVRAALLAALSISVGQLMLVNSIFFERTNTTFILVCSLLCLFVTDVDVKRVALLYFLLKIYLFTIMSSLGFFCMSFGCFVIIHVRFTFYTVSDRN